MRESVTFNGVTLSDLYEVAGVHRSMPARRLTTEEVSGADGDRIVTSSMSSLTITVSLVVGGGADDRMEAMRTLMPLLHTEGPAPLVIASDSGLYYMAMLSGEIAYTERIRSGLVEVSFVTEEPYLYGEERTATVPSQGQAQIRIGGTYQTSPVIRGVVHGASGTNLWGVTLDNGAHLYVNTGSTEGRQIEIDCISRTATLANELHLPTLDSDWFELTPGNHTIANTMGTGDCTLSWQERWI